MSWIFNDDAAYGECIATGVPVGREIEREAFMNSQSHFKMVGSKLVVIIGVTIINHVSKVSVYKNKF